MIKVLALHSLGISPLLYFSDYQRKANLQISLFNVCNNVIQGFALRYFLGHHDRDYDQFFIVSPLLFHLLFSSFDLHDKVELQKHAL